MVLLVGMEGIGFFTVGFSSALGADETDGAVGFADVLVVPMVNPLTKSG
jgi:hypothetical protein